MGKLGGFLYSSGATGREWPSPFGYPLGRKKKKKKWGRVKERKKKKCIRDSLFRVARKESKSALLSIPGGFFGKKKRREPTSRKKGGVAIT